MVLLGFGLLDVVVDQHGDDTGCQADPVGDDVSDVDHLDFLRFDCFDFDRFNFDRFRLMVDRRDFNSSAATIHLRHCGAPQ